MFARGGKEKQKEKRRLKNGEEGWKTCDVRVYSHVGSRVVRDRDGSSEIRVETEHKKRESETVRGDERQNVCKDSRERERESVCEMRARVGERDEESCKE